MEAREIANGLSAEERRDFQILVGAMDQSELRITGFRHKARFKKLKLVEETGYTNGGLKSKAVWGISELGRQVASILSPATEGERNDGV